MNIPQHLALRCRLTPWTLLKSLLKRSFFDPYNGDVFFELKFNLTGWTLMDVRNGNSPLLQAKWNKKLRGTSSVILDETQGGKPLGYLRPSILKQALKWQGLNLWTVLDEYEQPFLISRVQSRGKISNVFDNLSQLFNLRYTYCVWNVSGKPVARIRRLQGMWSRTVEVIFETDITSQESKMAMALTIAMLH